MIPFGCHLWAKFDRDANLCHEAEQELSSCGKSSNKAIKNRGKYLHDWCGHMLLDHIYAARQRRHLQSMTGATKNTIVNETKRRKIFLSKEVKFAKLYVSLLILIMISFNELSLALGSSYPVQALHEQAELETNQHKSQEIVNFFDHEDENNDRLVEDEINESKSSDMLPDINNVNDTNLFVETNNSNDEDDDCDKNKTQSFKHLKLTNLTTTIDTEEVKYPLNENKNFKSSKRNNNFRDFVMKNVSDQEAVASSGYRLTTNSESISNTNKKEVQKSRNDLLNSRYLNGGHSSSADNQEHQQQRVKKQQSQTKVLQSLPAINSTSVSPKNTISDKFKPNGELLIGPFASENDAPETISLSGIVYRRSRAKKLHPPLNLDNKSNNFMTSNQVATKLIPTNQSINMTSQLKLPLFKKSNTQDTIPHPSSRNNFDQKARLLLQSNIVSSNEKMLYQQQVPNLTSISGLSQSKLPSLVADFNQPLKSSNSELLRDNKQLMEPTMLGNNILLPIHQHSLIESTSPRTFSQDDIINDAKELIADIQAQANAVAHNADVAVALAESALESSKQQQGNANANANNGLFHFTELPDSSSPLSSPQMLSSSHDNSEIDGNDDILKGNANEPNSLFSLLDASPSASPTSSSSSSSLPTSFINQQQSDTSNKLLLDDQIASLASHQLNSLVDTNNNGKTNKYSSRKKTLKSTNLKQNIVSSPSSSALNNIGSESKMKKHYKDNKNKHGDKTPVIIVQKNLKPFKYHLLKGYLRLRRLLHSFEATYVFPSEYPIHASVKVV